MAKTAQMRIIELENGDTPIEDVLLGLFDELETIEAVAARLKIHRITLMDWLDDLGAERRSFKITRVRFPERTTAATAV
jgi:hypothetical protein